MYSPEEVLAIANKVVEIAQAKPDARYFGDGQTGGCSYTTGRIASCGCSEPGGCLVGQAITALGYRLPANDTGIGNFIDVGDSRGG